MGVLDIYPGDVRIFKPFLTGSDNATVPPNGYTLSFSTDTPNIVSITVDPATQTATVTGLSEGTCTITWTCTPVQPFYAGAPLIETDSVTVGPVRTFTVTSDYSPVPPEGGWQ